MVSSIDNTASYHQARTSETLIPPPPASDIWFDDRFANSHARVRLFCLPHAGGTGTTYHPWRQVLPDCVELCPVQLPGRGVRFRETPISDLRLLIQQLGEAIGPRLDKPFVIFGHSMGALLAYELTRLLRSVHRRSPLHLFVSGCRAPHIRRDDKRCSELNDQELCEELSRYNGTPEELLLNPAAMKLFLPVLRADFSAVENYQPVSDEPLDCAVSAVGGLLDTSTDVQDISEWKQYTRNDFSFHMLPGGHFFINQFRTELYRVLLPKLYSICQSLPPLPV